MSAKRERGERERGRTVGELARLAHVSVRALHHYDEIGLLQPSGRSRASYRLYTERDLARLQQVLLFRALGFSLDGIARVLNAPDFDRKRALLAQRALLEGEARRLEAMVALVDKTLDALERDEAMTDEDMFEGFDPSSHDEEARAKWGQSAAYAESARRTKTYTKETWATVRAEAQAIREAFAEAMVGGKRPGDPAVRALVERARSHLDRWFYPCSPEMHAALGQMYVDDPRFAATYEKVREGLAQFVRDAIVGASDRAGPERGPC
jgi:MerR family transcriptional regulator, thiopeptide resistance regulator